MGCREFLRAVALALCIAAVRCKENACIFVLCRNTDITGLKKTLSEFENRFNRKYEYPYVIVNDVEFTEEFKREISSVTRSKIEFGTVPKEHWAFPPWVDAKIAQEKIDAMGRAGVIYGGSLSYRHMCRYFSGFFYRHPLMEKYEYYWRIEPDTLLHCDVDYDVFRFMRENKKKYGFVIALHEFAATIPSLWRSVKRFVSEYNTKYRTGNMWEMVHPNSLKRFVTDEVFESYNLCHFWSNFEIGDLSFFRSLRYSMFFEYLDRSGGFFYERWGDAPVHSIAVSLFLDQKEVHYFEDIGYTHPPFTHCPKPSLQRSCSCKHKDSYEKTMSSCISLYRTVRMFGEKR